MPRRRGYSPTVVMAATPTTEGRDGRILPAAHWASLVVFAILVPALVILWGMPDRTADAWAWTIKPDLAPIYLGSGYGAGAYFFLRTFLSKQFHPSAAGIFAAAFFATLMLIATIIHWDRFNHGDAPLVGAIVFYGWVGVYIVSPGVLLALWWFNRRTDSGEPAPGEASVPAGVLRAAQAFAIGAFVVAAVFFLAPEAAIDVWPWDLTPLTSRVLGSFTAQVGVGALLLSLDRRWSAWKLIVQTFFVATALLLVGAIRAWNDFDTDNVMTYLYVGGLVAGDIALLLLYRSMTRQEGAARGAL
jgi:predicted small integral membrane protein